MSPLRRPRYRIVLVLLASVLPYTVNAQTAASFKDVPANSTLFAPVEYLKEKGVLKGYDDGTFKPNNKVNRAEALKIILTPLLKPEDLPASPPAVYSDVKPTDWFAPYVELGRSSFKVIDGPPKATTFQGEKPVLKVQFLKMFFLANDIDPSASYSELKLPLASDVQQPAEWYYPALRYAIATSMTMVQQDGTLGPAKELTRGDVALILYRYAMYQDGRRTQALLSEAEAEISNVLELLGKKQTQQAEFASARALIASRGALSSKPEDAVVKGAVKTAEGFQLLVQSYRAGTEGRLQDVLQYTSDAWHLAEKAREYSPNLGTLSQQMQTIAKNMADEARALLEKPK